MKHTQIFWLHTLSPTHVGTGQDVGYIDLPIQRDKVTGWPLIPASAFKGVWADHYGATEAKRNSDNYLRLAFGRASDRDSKESNAGALIPTDARLVCLPVRSFQGTFAWCTSQLALQLLHRDLSLAGMADLPPIPPAVAENHIHRTTNTKLEDNGRIFLEDLDFEGNECPVATAWAKRLGDWIFAGDEDKAWRDRFVERFAILPNAIFDFLTETGTEVSTRVKIDDNFKTVATGQLWNEEALPAETILSGLICCDRIYTPNADVTPDDLIRKFASETLALQIGGKASVGRGRVRCVFSHTSEGR
ncbi:MAG TPA: type III-B CRISPR module RAMP protein Cmr4 [Candidatus Binataceae bacterium]|nr:type III-B CRISPR module RAMP protein Cmr4 [Candidatus Binataceae bacterium]